MTMNNWPARFCICVAAAMTLWPVATVKADDNDTVIRSGEYADDVFVNGSHISVDAILQQDLFAAGEHVEVSGQVKGDLFAAGGQLDLASKVLGTLLAAGGQITVEGDVEDSAVVFGGDVEIKSKINGDVFLTAGKAVVSGPVSGDIRGAGGKYRLRGSVAGNVMVSGVAVELRDTIDIKGKATIGAGYLYVGGQIRKGLKAGAREIVIAGVIDGNVKLIAEKITLLPSARIRGDLVYRSPHEIKFDDTAQVAGDVTYIQSEDMRRGMGGLFAIAGGTHLVVVLGMIVVAALFILIAPPLFPSVEDRVRRQKWKALGLGLLFLVGGPFVMTLLTVTAVGIPLALILLALYFLIVMTGLLGGSYVLGQKFFSLIKQDFRALAWKQVAAAACGLVFLGLITLAPVIGAIVFILTTAFGVGALLSEGFTLCRGQPATA